MYTSVQNHVLKTVYYTTPYPSCHVINISTHHEVEEDRHILSGPMMKAWGTPNTVK